MRKHTTTRDPLARDLDRDVQPCPEFRPWPTNAGRAPVNRESERPGPCDGCGGRTPAALNPRYRRAPAVRRHRSEYVNGSVSPAFSACSAQQLPGRALKGKQITPGRRRGVERGMFVLRVNARCRQTHQCPGQRKDTYVIALSNPDQLRQRLIQTTPARRHQHSFSDIENPRV